MSTLKIIIIFALALMQTASAHPTGKAGGEEGAQALKSLKMLAFDDPRNPETSPIHASMVLKPEEV